ncbi:MAG: ABC transporter permease subunit [Pseudomonadota bacterium]
MFFTDPEFLAEFGGALVTTIWMALGIVGIFCIYLLFSALSWAIDHYITKGKDKARGFTSLKTVTFGDESAVTANRFASVASVIAIFILWMIATGSNLLPFQILPGPFTGQTQFEYTANNVAGQTANATVVVNVVGPDDEVAEVNIPEASGFAKNDSVEIKVRRTKILRAHNNDDGGKEDGYAVTEINGNPIKPGDTVKFDNGEIFMTNSGSLSVRPYEGLTMEALYLPPPEQVWNRFIDLNINGFQEVSLWEHVFWSLERVVVGFFLGCIFGIPLGFAMGLTGWLRGWFDPIVEFMRPVPPLALIPLIIIWFGINEEGKVSLLFLAALWIMTIAARAGVSGVNISKVHAAYSLGATKRQILSRVILPNSLPDIFTGARVAMGVCWGTVVAAELVAAQKGAGAMITAASKFGRTDIVIIGIIIIGVIGFGIEVLMRILENKLIPWKGRG